MSLMKRAWLSVSRRVGKTVVLLLIMTVIFSALMAETSVRAAMQNLRDNISRGVSAGFVVRPGSSELKTTDADSVSAVAGVTSHNYVRSLTAVAKDLKLIEMPASGVQLSDDVMPEGTVTGVTRTDLVQGFASKRYTLVEGRHLEAGDRHSAVVHQDFAARNGLKVGDQLTLTRQDKTVTVTIAGLYTGTAPGATLPAEMAENTFYTDLESSGELASSPGLSEAHYLVSSADELEPAISRARQLPLAWDSLQIEDNAKSTVEGLLNLLLAGVSLAGMVILVFVLVFWVRGRIHEIGILLSMGTSKARLLAQFVIELTMIAIAAGLLASLVAGQASHLLGDFVLGQAPGSGESPAAPDPSFTAASLPELGRAWLLGYGVVLLSAVVAVVPMLRLKPKQILSKMS